MRRILLPALALFVLQSQAQTDLYTEDFENFNTMETIMGQSDNWDAWSCNDYGPDAIYINDEQASSGTNSAKIDEGAGTDVVMTLETVTEGMLDINFKMYVPSGSGAYFNMLHNWACNGTGAEWACDIWFADSGDISWTLGGTDGTTTLPFNHDEWFDVQALINFGDDEIQLTIGSNPAISWQWSLNNANGMVGMNQFEALNFYGYSPDGSTPGLYYVDDIDVNYTAAVNINENTENEITMFPNPATDHTVLNGLSGVSMIRVVDLSGKEVSRETVNTNYHVISTASLAEGIYLIQINAENKIETRKLVVTK